MKTNVPLYLFWMKRQIKLGVELGYERGLQLLKSLIETGTTESKLYIKGLVKTEKTPYIGQRRKTSFIAYKSEMSSDFRDLISYTAENYSKQLNGPQEEEE
jgi:hypothetical protein